MPINSEQPKIVHEGTKLAMYKKALKASEIGLLMPLFIATEMCSLPIFLNITLEFSSVQNNVFLILSQIGYRWLMDATKPTGIMIIK